MLLLMFIDWNLKNSKHCLWSFHWCCVFPQMQFVLQTRASAWCWFIANLYHEKKKILLENVSRVSAKNSISLLCEKKFKKKRIKKKE